MQKDFSQSTHANTADTYKMNVISFDFIYMQSFHLITPLKPLIVLVYPNFCHIMYVPIQYLTIIVLAFHHGAEGLRYTRQPIVLIKQ